MEPGLFAQGFVLGFTIAASVGPISLLVIRRTLAEGQAIGMASGFGVATVDGAYGAVAAFGLTAVTAVLVDWHRVLALVGGCFLLWIAWQTFTAVPTAVAVERDAPRRGLRGAYLSIVALTFTNPMTILAFAALFIGLGVTGGDPLGATVLTAGVFLGSCAWWVILTFLVGRLRSRITPVWLRRVNVGSGLLIGAFAIVAIGAAIFD